LPKGDKAPGFYLKDMNEKVFRIPDFKGKLVYVFFWTILSESCIKEMQAINKLYSKLSGKPIEILNICLDNAPEKWKQIIEKEKLKGINLICKGNWAENLKKEYFIEEIPHFTLIDAKGLVIENSCDKPNEIFSTLKELLNN